MDISNIRLEEYRIAKDRVRTCESLKIKIVTLNLTALGVIIKVSNGQEIDFNSLFLISAINFFCFKVYRFQSQRQYLTAAYIIELYEDKDGDKSVLYESILDKSKNTKYFSNLKWGLRKFLAKTNLIRAARAITRFTGRFRTIYFIFTVIFIYILINTPLELPSYDDLLDENNYTLYLVYLIFITYVLNLLKDFASKKQTIKDYRSLVAKKLNK